VQRGWVALKSALALWACAGVLAPPAAFAQTADPRAPGAAPPALDFETIRQSKVVNAVRTSQPITLDGRLDEEAWNTAPAAADFLQLRPDNGAPAREQTEVRILYDDENIYVGVICFDSDPARITLNSIQRDFNTFESDGVTIVFDSLHDRRSGFSFTSNAAGAKRDQQLSNDGQGNPDWDGVWDTKTTRNDRGWVAEYVIPFKTLRFSNAPSQEWGLNIARRVHRINEWSLWAPTPNRYSEFRVSMAGTLRGLENIDPGRNLKVKPFASMGATQARGSDGRLRALPGKRVPAFDGGMDVKYSLTPSLTLDATYRTDFAQVEADQQQVNLTRFNLFFPEKRDFFLENAGIFGLGATRGFAQNNNLVPFFSRRIGLGQGGTPIPIVGGGRVSGGVGRYDVGFLTMKTERLGATPSNNFLVGRVKRNLLTNSWVGTLVTSRDSSSAGDYNRVYGTDAHFQFFNRLEFDSYLLRSDTPGRAGRNYAKRLQAGWFDDEVNISGEYNSVEPNFNPEAGFVRRSDMEHYAGDVSWNPIIERSALIRNLRFGTAYDYYEGSASGDVETQTSETTVGILFENNGSINFIVNDTSDRLPSALRIPAGTPRVIVPAGEYDFLSYTTNFSTNQRRMFSGSGAFNWGEFYSGDLKRVTGSFNLKPNYHLTVNFTYDRNHVALAEGAFTTQLIGAKVLYGFTPRAFFNAYIQYNTDTHLVSSNLRFNWTHHPLSDIYLVYNDTRDTALGQIRERAFIVKVTNLFNF
jgi:hypothetical protein